MSSGTTMMGMSYATTMSAAVANLIEYVTAGGCNSLKVAVDLLSQTDAKTIREEMVADGWEYHELLEYQGDAVVVAALKKLQSDD